MNTTFSASDNVRLTKKDSWTKSQEEVMGWREEDTYKSIGKEEEEINGKAWENGKHHKHWGTPWVRITQKCRKLWSDFKLCK